MGDVENKGSGCLGCLTIIFILAFIGWLQDGGWVIVLSIGVGAVLIWCAYKYTEKRKDKNIAERTLYEETERMILKLASQNEGYVTPVDVAVASNLTLEEANNVLDQLKRKGYATLRIADNGSYVYQFDGVLNREQRKQAERI